MTNGLNALTDPLVRSICTYLDAASLSKLGSLQQRFRPFSHQDPRIQKIQAIIQKQHLCDLGLQLSKLTHGKQTTILDAGKHGWLYCIPESQHANDYLLSKEGRFDKSPISLKHMQYIPGTAAYLVTKKSRNLHLRNTEGKILHTIPTNSAMRKVFAISSTPEKELLLLVGNASLEVWDIKEKKSKVKHHVGEILQAEQWGNIVALAIDYDENETPTLWQYDTNHPNQAPIQVVHPNHFVFDKVVASNKSQLYFQTSADTIVAAGVKSGALQYTWEWRPSFKQNDIIIGCVNEKWFVLGEIFKDYVCVCILDAKTGVVRNKFNVSSELEKAGFTLWDENILVAAQKRNLHFRYLPEGTPLPTCELENCRKIKQILVKNKQLLVHYEDEKQTLRLLARTTPEAISPLVGPKTDKGVDLSLCDRIWVCVSNAFEWLASLWRSLWN